MCFKFFSKKNKQIEPYISDNTDFIPFSDKKNGNTDFVSHHENNSYTPQNTDYATRNANVKTNPNYDFTLTEFGGEIEGGFREIENPTKEELERAIKNIVFYDGDFFTLISDEPINGFTMLEGQVLYGEDLITASAHVEFTTDKGKVVKAYDKSSVSSAGLLEMLTDFMNGRTPDINDGSWKFDEIVYSD